MTSEVIIAIASSLAFIALCIAATVITINIRNSNSDVRLNKDGLIVRAKSPSRISTKDFVNYMKEIISYVEDARESYVDDVIGIKNRYFKQSKDFAKSRIEAVKNQIIEEYKVTYMDTYTGFNVPINETGENVLDPNFIPPTIQQLDITPNDCKKGTKKPKAVSPCSSICPKSCNSGLAFFDSRIQKDFKPILEEVYRIIEENHLINRSDREYEEEITTKAEQLSSYLKNIIISYPVPIDNKIAKEVIDRRCPDVKDAIADSLRRSRTLSMTKREAINVEKKKYIEKRDKQVAQIITILSDEDTSNILSEINKEKIDD